MEFTENSSEEFKEKKVFVNNDPDIYYIDDVITKEECEHFINLAKPNLKRACVSDTKQGTISQGRTGSNYWIRHSNDEVTLRVGQRIASIVNIPLENAEAFQFIHYDPNQSYNAHYDAYQKNNSEKSIRCMRHGGQRMVTALIYFNEVEEGGETTFPTLKKSITPKMGRIGVFQNCKKGTNELHPDSLHAGAHVIQGEKYACNLWFREISMQKIYDFPYLKLGENNNIEIKNDESLFTQLSSNEKKENKVIELNTSKQENEMTIHKYSEEPYISQIQSALTSDECDFILKRCVNGNTQVRGRKSYWVRLDEPVTMKLAAKISAFMGVDRKFFENINVMAYPVHCDHGNHFDAFNLETDRGKEFSKCRGQRLYTIIGLLNENEDPTSGVIRFRNYDHNIIQQKGDILIYKNTLNDSEIPNQRNDKLEYSISSIDKHPVTMFYLYLRERDITGNSLSKEKILEIDNTLKNLDNNIKTIQEDVLNNRLKIVDDKKKEEDNTDYNQELQDFMDTFMRTKKLNPINSLKFRRSCMDIDVDIVTRFGEIRENNLVNGNRSLLNPENLNKDYKQNEYSPVIVEDVFLPEVTQEIYKYFDYGIENNKFAFGDKQSQRYKAYDEFMCRLMSFEARPLMERITGKKLKPTYTYLSCYKKDADLPAHTDRPECEFTVSFMIKKPEGSRWPIYVDKRKLPVKFRGRYREYDEHDPKNLENCIPVDCNTGGLMLFQGTDHIHFRHKLEEDYYNIVLLHYMLVH
jgi:prolyl 4-hydroxylase